MDDRKDFEALLDYVLKDIKKRDKLYNNFNYDAGGQTYTVASSPKPKGSPATHDQWTDDDGVVWWVHRWKRTCVDDGCAIHCPTAHHMLDWPMVMRSDTLIERLCNHGLKHPDPDSLRFFRSVGKFEIGEHTCDGCCFNGFSYEE
jgi:hypothetical protein